MLPCIGFGNQAIDTMRKGRLTASTRARNQNLLPRVDLQVNLLYRRFLLLTIFERIILLSTKLEKGEIEKVYGLDKVSQEYIIY